MSTAGLAALRGSHHAPTRARVCTTYQTGTNPAGTEIDIIDGDVQLDGTADIRSTVDITTDGTAMWPTAANTLLTPYGHELFVERGVDLGGAGIEWVSLGYFRINTPEQDQPPDGPIRISGGDRMSGIIDGRLLAPRQYQSADTYGAVVDDLVIGVYPTATIIWDDSTDTDPIGRDVIVEQDRYAFLRELVTSVGKVVFWNHRGELVITDPPDPTAPVYDITHGADGVLVNLTRHLTRERVYNAVVAVGEAADTEAPVRAVAVDDNPSSPTYFYGDFGPVPTFFNSPFITTVGQAASAAAAILRRTIGLPYSVDFGAVPNPALEPYDPVTVSYSDRHAEETHILQHLTIPLTPSTAMQATTREQTLTIVGAA